MLAPEPAPARRSVRFFFTLAALALAFGILIEVIGGINTRVSGVRISAHGFFRPLLFALACFMVGFWRLDAQGRDRLIQRLSTLWLGVLPWLVPIAAAIVLWLGLAFGTRAAGGSDPYGYVSQSELWRQGDLRVHQAFVDTMPWPNADWTFTPLGYRPAANHTLVPTYAPGLPRLMAIFMMAFGACRPYVVGPVCGALLVLLTYGLGVKLSDKVVGAIAALCIAASPTVLFMSLWPMSDVPCATFWAASLLLATRRTSWASAASGIAAGIAIAIRPNLVPLALGPLAIALWRSAPAEPRAARNRVRQLLAFSAGCVPFVLFIGWLFNDLYGSPLRSGYGDSGSFFAWSNLKPNLLRYPAWLWDTQGPLAFLFLLAPALRAGNVPLRRLYLAFIAAVVAAYLW